MKGFALLASVLAVATLDDPIPAKYRFSPEGPVLIQFHETVWELPEVCNIELAKDLILHGCYVPDTKTTHVPNPCYFPEAKNRESFAFLMCHENGHTNGWRHN